MTKRDRIRSTLNRLWWAALALVALVLVGLSIPYALSAHYLERAGDAAAIADLERALAWDGRNVQARRALARGYLAQGQSEAALQALQPALDVVPVNPLAASDLVPVYVALDQPAAAIAAYESAGVSWPSAAAALAYLDQAESGDARAASGLWRRALAADPGNLYALMRLWQAARAAGDDATAADLADRLRYFDLQAVAVPVEAGLAEYQARAMAGLVEAGVWTRETLLNVVSYQVWQFAEGEAGARTEHVLDGLLVRWPGDADLRFYRAELYHRRGEWERAEAAYRAVLEVDADYAQAYLRLGMVFEAREDLATAAEWYTRYRALAPDDLLGLKRLVEVQEALGAADAAALREAYLDLTDDRRIVARLMGVPVDEVQLGDNLIRNGDFASWVGERPEWWTVSDMATGHPSNKGLFVGGPGDFSAPVGGGVRIQGLWLRQQADKEPGRWGYWYFDEPARHIAALALEADRYYVVSFDYRGDVYEQKGAAIKVSERDEVLWSGDYRLPSTGSAWRHVMIIASNRGGAQAVIRLLLRSWVNAIVEFDRVWVSPLMLSTGLREEVAPVQIWSSGS